MSLSSVGAVKTGKAFVAVSVRTWTGVPRRRKGPPGNGRSGGAGRACYGTSFRSLLGEPVPALVTTPEVAPFTRAEATVAGVAEVCPAR